MRMNGRTAAYDIEFHIRELLDIVEATRVSVRERLHSGNFRRAGVAWDSLLECGLVIFALVGTLFRHGVRLGRLGAKCRGWKRSRAKPSCRKQVASGKVKPRDCSHPLAVNDIHHANASRRLSIFTPYTLKQNVRKQGPKKSDAHSLRCGIDLMLLIPI